MALIDIARRIARELTEEEVVMECNYSLQGLAEAATREFGRGAGFFDKGPPASANVNMGHDYVFTFDGRDLICDVNEPGTRFHGKVGQILDIMDVGDEAIVDFLLKVAERVGAEGR